MQVGFRAVLELVRESGSGDNEQEMKGRIRDQGGRSGDEYGKWSVWKRSIVF